ncbi:hypothetical protein GY45DRAFT_988196 [Cubamyces sp. BRFM 1775]|nr:hypothetical protein GY45DRAFT_988196 [Cubamyces sp. BRFM 1775]
MFSVPETHAERQVVELAEDTDTLEPLLRMVCPVERPKFAKLSQIRPVLAAAQKYMMSFVLTSLEDTLRTFVESDPLGVYAVAYSYRMRGVIIAAAKQLMGDPHLAEPATPPPEFDAIPARALYEISAYRKRCGRAAVEAVQDWHWMVRGRHARAVYVSKKGGFIDHTNSWVWLVCTDAHKHEKTPNIQVIGAAVLSYNPPRWWWDYIGKLDKELVSRPIGELAFDPSIIGPPLRKAASCPTCTPNALADLVEYGQMLAKRIDAATAEVKLAVSF